MPNDSKSVEKDRQIRPTAIELLATEPTVQPNNDATLSPTNLPDGQTNKDD